MSTIPNSAHHQGSPTMRALGFVARPAVGDAAAALRWVDVPMPSPRRGEVRVRVVAAAVNRDDVHAAEGTIFGGIPVAPRPTLDAPLVPGIDLAGVVDAVGEGVRDLVVGQRVFGVVYMGRLGSLAPFCCTKASRLRPLPHGWSFADGAATGFTGSVASMALKRAGAPKGMRCVVVGASGNIGGLIVQALVHAGASEVVGVCSGANAQHVTSLGAGRVVDYTKGPWSRQLGVDVAPFDLVFDCVGGRDTEAHALEVLHGRGHLVTLCGPIRFLGGTRLPWTSKARAIAYIMRRSLWSRLRGPRYTFLSGTEPDWSALNHYLLEPAIKPIIDIVHRFDRDEVAAAMRGVTTSRSKGKRVVSIRPDEEVS